MSFIGAVHVEVISAVHIWAYSDGRSCYVVDAGEEALQVSEQVMAECRGLA